MSDILEAAGEELDRKVAVAIGLIKSKTTYGIRWLWEEGDETGVILGPCDCEFGDGWSSCEHWSPSTDLNDAFDAAEEIGLFAPSIHNAFLSRVSSDEWGVMWGPYNDRDSFCECTPDLAICGAILKLNDKPNV